MRNVLLWSLVILVAAAITTAVVAEYVQRHPDTLVAHCLARVTGGSSCSPQDQCPAAVTCQMNPFIDLKPEDTLQAMKDLDIIAAMADELATPPQPEVPPLPRNAEPVRDEFTPPVMPPVDDALHGIVMTTPVEVPTATVACPAQCQGAEACCVAKPGCQQCTSCDQESCCASQQLAILKRAVEALTQAGKLEEARAVAAQMKLVNPAQATFNVSWQFAPCQADCGQPRECEQVNKLPRVAAWQAPGERVVEFVMVQPRVVCPMPPQFGFVQHLPAPNVCNVEAMPTGGVAGVCAALPGAPQFSPIQFNPNAIAGILACQGGPTFLEGFPPGCCEADEPKTKVETYDVGHLIDESMGASQDRLMELLVRMVAPTSWDVCGGYASMDVYPLGNVLVVRQTAEVHEEMSAFLGKLQTAVATATKKATPALTSAAPCCSSKLVRVVYPVADLLSSFEPSAPQQPMAEDKLIEALRQAVEPCSWDTNGGPGQVDYYPMCKSLVISQNSRCHERITLFLDRLRAPRQSNVKTTGFDFASEVPGIQVNVPPPGPKTPEQLPDATKK
jgi:hypothetical protein